MTKVTTDHLGTSLNVATVRAPPRPQIWQGICHAQLQGDMSALCVHGENPECKKKGEQGLLTPTQAQARHEGTEG